MFLFSNVLSCGRICQISTQIYWSVRGACGSPKAQTVQASVLCAYTLGTRDNAKYKKTRRVTLWVWIFISKDRITCHYWKEREGALRERYTQSPARRIKLKWSDFSAVMRFVTTDCIIRDMICSSFSYIFFIKYQKLLDIEFSEVQFDIHI